MSKRPIAITYNADHGPVGAKRDALRMVRVVVKRHGVDNATLKATLNLNLPNNSCRRTHDNYVWFIERFIYN